MCSLVTVLVNKYNVLVIVNKTYNREEISHFCYKLIIIHLKFS